MLPRWRAVRARANGQEALGFYTWDPDREAHLPFALNVLTFRGEPIVKDDIDITHEDMKSSNLVLWGDPHSNKLLATLGNLRNDRAEFTLVVQLHNPCSILCEPLTS